MRTINDFKSELQSLKDTIGTDLVPALEHLSAILDSSISVLDSVMVHDMDIQKKDFKSIIAAVNDEISAFKSLAKGTAKIRFAEIWAEEADNSLRAIKQAEIEEAEETEIVESENIDPVIPE